MLADATASLASDALFCTASRRFLGGGKFLSCSLISIRYFPRTVPELFALTPVVEMCRLSKYSLIDTSVLLCSSLYAAREHFRIRRHCPDDFYFRAIVVNIFGSTGSPKNQALYRENEGVTVGQSDKNTLEAASAVMEAGRAHSRPMSEPEVRDRFMAIPARPFAALCASMAPFV